MSIRWSKGDYIRLGRAVADFNREIAKNTTEANKLYLPDKVDYNELKDSIQTRKGLEDYIKSMKRIKTAGAFNLEKLEGGEIITAYQKGELSRSIKSSTASLSAQIKSIENQTKVNLGLDSDIKLPQAFKSAEQKQLEATLTDFKHLFNYTGKDFKRKAREIGINWEEKRYRRAYQFMINYKTEMKKYKDFANYDLLQKWFRNHKNPISFYDSLPDNEYYPDDLQYQSDKVFTQEQFNSFLEGLGIDFDSEVKKREERRKAKEGDYYNALYNME